MIDLRNEVTVIAQDQVVVDNLLKEFEIKGQTMDGFRKQVSNCSND